MDKQKKQELYKQMQAVYVEENDLRVGDKVRVLRHIDRDELGSRVMPTKKGDRCTKSRFVDDKAVGIIESLCCDCVEVNCGYEYNHDWQFPFHVLEIVDQPRDPVITCKFYTEDGKEVKMSPDSARNFHEAAAKE